ncbi:hypothetical protein DP806_16730 [Salmonella enterica subsp. enterica serovar Saintpaul]|nr:hypothetical protein [Salmonella enterica subsp. enterica serovar Saintpaul]
MYHFLSCDFFYMLCLSLFPRPAAQGWKIPLRFFPHRGTLPEISLWRKNRIIRKACSGNLLTWL